MSEAERCRALLSQYHDMYDGGADELAAGRILDSALASFEALPPGHAQAVGLAAELAEAILRTERAPDPGYLTRALALADLVDSASEGQPPDWPEVSSALRLMGLLLTGTVMDPAGGYDPTAGVHRLDQLAPGLDDSPQTAMMAAVVRVMLQIAAMANGSHASGRRQVLEEAERAAERLSEVDPELRDEMQAFLELPIAVVRAHEARDRGDDAGMRAAVQAARAATDRLPEDFVMSGFFAGIVEALELNLPVASRLADTRDPSSEESRSAFYGAIETAAERLADVPGQGEIAEMRRLTASASRLLIRGAPEDLDAAIDSLERAAHLQSSLQLPGFPIAATMAGDTYLRRYRIAGSRDDLRRAIALLEQALNAISLRAHAEWTLITVSLCRAYYEDGRASAARAIALKGLRGGAWNALVATDAPDAHAMVREAAASAISTARLLREVGRDAAAAATALESGRGLILFAAQTTRGLAARLDSLGHPDLARRWQRVVSEQGAASIPGDLRVSAIGALAGVALGADGLPVEDVLEAGEDLLKPPDLHEVRAALARLGADVLVYLVPADDEMPGFAIVVPAHEEPSDLTLPGLTSDFPVSLEGYVDAVSRQVASASERGAGHDTYSAWRRDAEIQASTETRDVLPEPSADTRGADAVDEACDWAWRVAIGPVLEHLSGTMAVPSDRPPRLVLVPMHELALVPWHAARRVSGGHTVYALEDAVFSYAVSARQLCDSAWRGPVPVADTGLVVGDPAALSERSALPSARAEAAAIKQAFYPRARYLGRGTPDSAPPDGRGTPAEVLDWFGDPEQGSVLHFACHGTVHDSVDRAGSSYLLLDAGTHLTAEQFDDALRSIPQGRDVALAVLAACSTAKSGRGYDEAFNLGTVLLTGGVRSVVSAQWPVPDADTSVLMFMVHHYIRREGLRPVDALRAAQMWMLTDRQPPASMPPPLREHLTAQRSVEPGVRSWAGFVHFGW